MRREIERPAIRLGLDDSAGRHALGGAMYEDLADAFARHLQDRTLCAGDSRNARAGSPRPSTYANPITGVQSHET